MSRHEIERRRTFAIISHPDAGKTTLTEKLLLYSNMIQTAGMVRARKGRKSATSDWMALEQERGISITASAMQFPYRDCMINILDTPGHEDFSEDTYRTLTAADCAIMVIDAGKGVEKQTRKLFEVCKIRRIPVMTFINKMDMPGRDPLDLMNEVEEVLGIETYAYNWPIGSGREFAGVVDRSKDEALFFSKDGPSGTKRAIITKLPYGDSRMHSHASDDVLSKLADEKELLDIAGNAFDRERFLEGKVTPVFFASALSNYGVEPFFDAFIQLAPSPRKRIATDFSGNEKVIDPYTDPFSAYVFKIQSNMNKKHRDSMAFLRICSGVFEKDTVVYHSRLRKEVRVSRPHNVLAGERVTIETAYAGDIIGVINPGLFAIGDTISSGGNLLFPPLPQFQPEIFAKVTPKDIQKRKSFDKGIERLAEEGTIQVLLPNETYAEPIFGVVGKLQLEVMQYRLLDEYSVDTSIYMLPYECSMWVEGDISKLKVPSSSKLVFDSLKKPMVLCSSQWEKKYAMEQNPEHTFSDISR